MIVAGIGCRAGAPARDIEAAIAAALTEAQLAPSSVDVIATSVAKEHEPAIATAASTRGVRFVVVTQVELEAAAAGTVTRSERVFAIAGVPSVSEAAALAAAGAGARLLVPRIAIGQATCALAVGGDTP